MITDTNAIINPGAVMIESFNASITYGAVSRSGSSYDFTVGTALHWINHLQCINELNVFRLFNVARFREHSGNPCDQTSNFTAD